VPIYVVRDSARWGHSINVVRADSPSQARRFVREDHDHPDVRDQMECEEVPEWGDGIVWCYDESGVGGWE
jgi:hypothetical protein